MTGVLQQTAQIRVDLYGSLAMTGIGHGTPNAVLMGLEGETPEGVEPSTILSRVERMSLENRLKIGGDHSIDFHPDKHLLFHYGKFLPQHPNGMRFSAFDSKGDLVATNEFFSIGGGFVVNEATKLANVYWKDPRVDHVEAVDVSDLHPENVNLSSSNKPLKQTTGLKETSALVTASLPFHNAESLKQVCIRENLRISQVVFKNELHWRSAEEITTRTLNLWKVMNQSIVNGVHSKEEFLPGKLHVKRRAPKLYKRLMGSFAEFAGLGSAHHAGGPAVGSVAHPSTVHDIAVPSVKPPQAPKRRLPALDWISLFALAVNEENAAGGRVVTGR